MEEIEIGIIMSKEKKEKLKEYQKNYREAKKSKFNSVCCSCIIKLLFVSFRLAWLAYTIRLLLLLKYCLKFEEIIHCQIHYQI